jgi:hypothetical protein
MSHRTDTATAALIRRPLPEAIHVPRDGRRSWRLLASPYLWAAAALSVAPAQARDDFASAGYGTGAAAYLALPAHAHGAAMSEAATAWRTELAGLQWNPAILDGADSNYIIASYGFLTSDRKHIAVDAAVPIGSYVVLGASFVKAGVSAIERRDDFGTPDPDNPYFSDAENSCALSVAGRLACGLALGGRARYLHQSLAESWANGMGFDAGATYRPDPRFCIGASLLNVGSYLWWNTGHCDQTAMQGRVGVAGLFLKRSLIVEGDLAGRPHQPLDGMMGAECTFFDILSVRLGARSSVSLKPWWTWRNPSFSGGVGLRYLYFGCDYAIVIPTDDTGLISHRVSLVLRLPRLKK